ncbi:MAG: hypothetical protein WA678_03525 [Rhabdochlamydiaceae bacterium]
MLRIGDTTCEYVPFIASTNETTQDNTTLTKTEGISDRIWNATVGSSIRMWSFTQAAVGGKIRDIFFFPLNNLNNPAHLAQLAIEKKYAANFWKSDAPLDLNFPFQGRIRKEFEFRNETVQLTLPGKELFLTYRVIESRSKSHSQSQYYNFVLVPGNVSTIDGNVVGIYPFLASYLDLKREDEDLLPGRFIIITQYDVECAMQNLPRRKFQPETLEEAGVILKKTLEHLKQKFGAIDHLFAHSMGTILFAAASKQIGQESDPIFPKHLSLHCAPSSISETSKNYWGGSMLLALAKFSGWSFDIEKEIADLCQKYREDRQFSILVSGVKQDYYFPNQANLCLSKTVTDLNKKGVIDLLVFDLPQQVVHERAHHGLRIDWLHSNYLTGSSNFTFIEDGEQFAKALIRRSLPDL